MLKSRIVLFAAIIATLLSLSSAIASAQAIRNPTQQETDHAKKTGPCRDPWISIALTYQRLGNYLTGSSPTSYIAGVGDLGQCNAALYNGGSWRSFAELYSGVQTAFRNMSGNVSITMTSLGGDRRKITIDAGGGFTGSTIVRLVGNDSASIISHDSGTVVAAGGGKFRVQSVGNEKRINLGKSVLIVRKK